MVICCLLLAALEEVRGCVEQPELLEVSSRERFLLWRSYAKPGAVIGKQGMRMEERLSIVEPSSNLNNSVLGVEAELSRMNQVGRLL